MPFIYHITTEAEWQKGIAAGEYSAASLEKEGFIHCCEEPQMAGVLERYFSGKKNLMAIMIDTEKLNAPVKYEWSPLVHELFPHIYGTVPPGAVNGIIKL
jgi:uncharacterized protein (DUF952 family)